MTVHAHDIFGENSQLARRLCAATVVITVCNYNRDHIASTHPEAASKITVIPCSTRSAHRGRRELVDNDVPVILSVGRMVEKKGFDDLLKAVALEDEPCQVVLIGDGPLRPDLDALTVQLGLADRVVMLGALDHQATLDWFGQARHLRTGLQDRRER